MTTPLELDPRYDWVEIRQLGDVQSTYVRGACKHLDTVPVEAGGDVVARLCRTCDAQLPA